MRKRSKKRQEDPLKLEKSEYIIGYSLSIHTLFSFLPFWDVSAKMLYLNGGRNEDTTEEPYGPFKGPM